MAWRMAKALTRLKDQINASYPNRNKASDGGIGNSEHASRASDHNPWIKVNGMGVVSALDITHHPAAGVDGSVLSESFINDPRTKYVIFAGRIWKARTGKWESYHGPNSHHHHVHLSIKPDLVDNEEPWPLSISPSVTPLARPVLKKGDRGPAVTELQTKLRKHVDVSVDGIFGAGLERALKIFQRQEGLVADGIAGEKTFKALGL